MVDLNDLTQIRVMETGIQTRDGIVPDSAWGAIRDLITRLQAAYDQQRSLYGRLSKAGYTAGLQPPEGA